MRAEREIEIPSDLVNIYLLGLVKILLKFVKKKNY